MEKFAGWQEKAKLLRKLSLESTTNAGSGHPTSCLSAADVMAVLFDSYFSYDLSNPLLLSNDRLIFSKGHAAPLFYALYAVAGAFPLDELKTLRQFTSRLEGHPTPQFLYTDAATGSLGQGLSVGAGMAYFAKQQGIKNHVYVLLGDGELAEGQIWEAANFASYYKLHNLVAIADINRLAQSQETMLGHDMETYEKRFNAFGFETIVVDGHNFEEIEQAFEKIQNSKVNKPFALLAKTFKGKGITSVENLDDKHGKALSQEDLEKALSELGPVDESVQFQLKKPQPFTQIEETSQNSDKSIITEFNIGDEVATREIYGKVLAELALSNPTIYALDGDVKNSTYSQDFLKVYPQRFIECFIAEQNMVSVAVGLSRLGRSPFVSTFAAFFTRAFVQIRMAALSHANIRFVGSHAGVAIGEDGSSQMGLEDIAMFGSLPDSVILQPSDGVSAAKLLEQMSKQSGISYMRTLRSKTPVLYGNDEKFPIGGSKILHQSDADVLTIVATGITVHEALRAYEELKKESILVRVVDCYSLKPIDEKTMQESVKSTQQPILISIEDHFEHGGLGDLVLNAVTKSKAVVHKMAVRHFSHSGKKEELLDDAQISAKYIVEKVKELYKG